MDQRLHAFLQDLLGEAQDPDATWVYYICPFCAKVGKIKRKFAINVQSFQWKCWVCQQRGNNLFSLLRKLNKWHFKQRLFSLKVKKPTQQGKKVVNTLQLPKQFIPLSGGRQFLLKPKALKYLRRRNITDYQIRKFNIGVCQTGRYQNRIIIPSYDQNGNLNYFTGRSMDKQNQYKYLNPKFQKDKIIVFQNMVNWNYPIIITQGMFDAITVNFNSIPLMGKTLPQKLLQKMLYYDAHVIVSLDPDAEQAQQKIVKKLNNMGLYQVYYVNLKDKDPNQMGRINYWKYVLSNKRKYTISSSLDVLKQKVRKIYK